MSNNHLQVWLKLQRDITSEERQWLDKLLSRPFEGRDILAEQLETARVVGYCPCGCRTIDIEVQEDLPRYPFKLRIPVEMTVETRDGSPILFLLHVVDGYVRELEVFRADSSPIVDEVSIERAVVTVHQPDMA